MILILMWAWLGFPPHLYLSDMVGFFSVIFQAGAVGGGGWPQSISWWVEDDLTHNWQNHRLALSQSSKHQHVSAKQWKSFSVSTDGFHWKYTLCNIFPIQLQFEWNWKMMFVMSADWGLLRNQKNSWKTDYRRSHFEEKLSQNQIPAPSNQYLPNFLWHIIIRYIKVTVWYDFT